MAGRGRMDAKRQRVIAALMATRTITEAAQLAQVGERSIYRWIAEDDQFRAALRAAEGQSIDQAARRLLAGQDTALDTLEALMTGAQAEGVKRQAANDWLTHLIRLRELRDIRDRISEIERILDDDKYKAN